MKSILKPCPFCGSLEIAIGSDEGTVTRHNTAFGDLTRTVPSARWAYCCTCGCSAPSVKVKNYKGWYDEKEQADALERAIAAWNRRTEQESELLVRCGECEKYQSPHCATKHEQALMDFCSHGVRKPERSELDA